MSKKFAIQFLLTLQLLLPKTLQHDSRQVKELGSQVKEILQLRNRSVVMNLNKLSLAI